MNDLDLRLRAYRLTLEEAVASDHAVRFDMTPSTLGLPQKSRWMVGAAAAACLVALVAGAVVLRNSSSGTNRLATVSPSSSNSIAPSPTSAQIIDQVTLDPTDPRPVLQIRNRGFIEDPNPILDLSDLSIYPDGRVIRVRVDALQRHSITTLTAYLDPKQIEEIMIAARRAGLVGTGRQRQLLESEPSIIDGGSTIFVARSGEQVTAREILQLGNARAGPDDTERAAFDELHDELLFLYDEAMWSGDETRLDQWAVVSTPMIDREVRNDARQWTGPDLSTLTWEAINDSSQCAIVEHEGWSNKDRQRLAFEAVIDSRVVTWRPLLPHETGCSDVAELRVLLELDGPADPNQPAPIIVAHSPSPSATGGIDGPVIFGPENDVGQEALAAGTLELQAGCLVLVSVETAATNLVVWHSKTAWNPDDSTLSNSGETIRLGDQIELGGGETTVDGLALYLTDAAALAEVERCLAESSATGIFVNQHPFS
jgi:hypothetical protein